MEEKQEACAEVADHMASQNLELGKQLLKLPGQAGMAELRKIRAEEDKAVAAAIRA